MNAKESVEVLRLSSRSITLNPKVLNEAIAFSITAIQENERLEEALERIKETAVIHRNTLDNIRHIIGIAKQALSSKEGGSNG
jgi:hypothetical protein